MKTIRKLKWMLVVVLLGWASVANAHVYWKPNSGNDSNDGSTAAKAVKSWARAKALLAAQDNSQWIYLTEQLTISANTTMDGAISGKANARVKRNIASGYLIIVNASRTLTLKNITISGTLSSSTPNPNGVKSIIATYGVVILDNGSVLRDNHAKATDEPWGGAIRLYNGSTLTMKAGSLITGCKAQKSGGTNLSEGGAVMSGGNCTVNINGGTIENCTSGDIGGAFALRGGNYTFNMTGGTIKDCTARQGGALYIAPIYNSGSGTFSNVNATITMSGGTIQNCSATNNAGGGMFLGSTTGTVRLNLNGGIIDGCSASYMGGGIAVEKGTFVYNMTGGTIKNCTSVRYGGGIFVGPITELGSQTQVKASMNISGGLIENCVVAGNPGSYSYGGGIYLDGNVEGSTLTMTGGKIHGCSAHTLGGGIDVRSATTVSHFTKGEIYECIAAGDTIGDGIGRGGGIALHSSTVGYIDGDEMLIHDNVCKHYGGGVQVDGGSTLYFSKGKVYNNTAGYVEPEKVSCGAAGLHITAATLHMSGGDLYDNRTRGVGGGIHASYEGVMEITGGLIHDNIAEIQGGGINLNTQCDLRVPTGSTLKIYDNEAGIGGAILLDGANLYIHDGEYYGNKALDTYPTNIFESGAGGAFCLIMDRGDVHHGDSVFPANFYMYGGDIHDNTASNHGGGLFVAKNTEHPLMGVSHITIKGGNMHENEAVAGHGGGIYADAGCIFYMADTLNGVGYIQNNTAKRSGGGVYLTDAKFTIEAGAFLNNTAGEDGGGFYIAGDTASVVIKGGEIKNNSATQNGGGFAVEGGTVNISQTNTTYPTLITNNHASNNGGGFWVDVASASDTTFIKGGATVSNNTAVNGAGAYINQGRLVIQDAATNLTSNTASTSGGGIYMAAGTVTFTNAKMQNNTATAANGGGLYLGSGAITVSGASAAIRGNHAQSLGGGVYVGGGSYTMTGGAIGGTTAQGNTTTGYGSYGGGLYMGGGTATITGGSISGNQTDSDGMGGGIYMNGGTCTLSGGATIGGSSLAYANNAKYGGGIYSRNGSITVKGGIIDHNTAVDGGGIYSNGPDATVKITKEGDVLSYMRYNRAGDEYTPGNGGGIYANRGTVEFTEGNILYNHASEAGGGMYVNDEGTLKLKGSAILNRNHVPTGKNGGGVYLKGTVVVGESSKAQSSVKADMNFAHNLEGTETVETYEPTVLTRNNIYLPVPEAHAYTETNHRDVITVIEGGISTTSHIGFSVPHNHVPVIFCTRSATSWDYLDRFTTGAGHDLNLVLFDDSERYKSVHYTTWPSEFDPDHVYLYGFWPEAVTSLADVPDNGFVVNGDTVTISNKEGLAWLISYVNGLNGSAPHTSSDLVVNLEADVAMGDFGWVPIGFLGVTGSTPEPFQGTFNGNGHIVSDISGLVYGQGLEGVLAYGMFGYVNDADINNVFVKNLEYHIDNNPDLVMGTLVGEVAGATNINNSEAQGVLVASNPNAILGGLIGRIGNTGTGSPTIHSTMAISNLTGGTMGGLIGSIVKGDMLNSFANTLFNKTGASQYAGGLVAINRGNVENCYSRLRPTIPTSNFGSLVGDNNNGTVTYCYAHPGQTTYKVAGADPTGHGNFGTTILPYLYGHRDTQVTLANGGNDFVPAGEGVDKQMLIALNGWVNQDAAHKATYTKWGRPWQVSEDMKPLNDDYPILRMPEYEAVAAQNGDPYLYYGLVDDLMADHTAADEAIWMYKSSENVTGDNSTSAAKLYIAEDVVLLNDNELTAYVGVTLDNSAGLGGAQPTYAEELNVEPDATDWHMIATPLSDAPIGIDYSDNGSYDFSWGHPEGMPYYLFYPKGNARHGYFPSHRFGKDYPTSDATIEEGSYFNEWDFYSYDETNYHWINFKRNSNSHHHFDTEGHEAIEYHNGDPLLADDLGNESRLVPGKGYFAATREETFLQCLGTLNAGEVNYNLTRTEGVPRHGYNLLGNPYQAYLDFDLFAEANSEDEGAIWDDHTKASYTILDEDYERTIGGDSVTFYHTYLYGSSDNEGVGAGRFIHPHQGFFVLLEEPADAATAYFEPDQRNATDTVTSKFRGDAHINYPLVNLFAIEENGLADVVTIELGRPTEGGAKVMKGLRLGNGKMWCHYNDEDYTIAYTLPGVSEANIRFESVEDTEYTMRWSTRNGEFSYLHLIDNMTGADVDCLSTSEYKFSARKSDYKSRFRLVFGYTGIEEPEEVETSQNFAFVMGDELVVTGEGVLQVFDVNGRLVAHQELHGVQTTMALPNVANGVYVMRLTEGKQSRIQKMVISK